MTAPRGMAARILPILAEHPGGLLTEEVAALLGETSRKHVVEALRHNERRGSVSAQRRGQGVTVIWRITEQGLSKVRDARSVRPQEEEKS